MPVSNNRAARRVRSILNTPVAALNPPWSNQAGWNGPSYYSTIRAGDIEGDGKAELAGRGVAGVELWWFDSVAAAWTQIASGQCNWTDANGWTDLSRAETIRMADVNGDGRCELIARNSGGMEAWAWNQGAMQQIASGGCGWTDANQWNQPGYYSTILCADVNGDGVAEVVGRGPNGVEVWSCVSGQWTQLGSAGCNWTDANGWNQPQYYLTILAADVNGDGIPELVGRSSLGIEVWSFQASGQWTQLSYATCNWTDANGWAQAQYYSTIRAADVNGDGKAELIGRSSLGIEVWSLGAGNAWSELASAGCGWTDAAGWNAAEYYMTITAADVNGDGKAELTARGTQGLQTWAWQDGGQWLQIGTDGGTFSDGNGWTDVSCYSTLVTGDINDSGSAALMGRSPQGEQTVVFNAAGGMWQSPAPLLKVDSRFSQNYLMETPVPAGAEMAAAVNASGQVELFVVGSDRNVYNTYPDPASDTGWSTVNTGLSGVFVAAALAPNGGLMVVTGDGNAFPYVSENLGSASTKWSAPAIWTLNTMTIGRPTMSSLNGALYFGAVCVTGSGTNEFSMITAVWPQGPYPAPPDPSTPISLGTKPAETVACGSLSVDSASGSVSYTAFLSDGTPATTKLLAGSVAPKTVGALSPLQSNNNGITALPPAWTQVLQLNGNTMQLLLDLQLNNLYSYWNGSPQKLLNLIDLNTKLPLQRFTAAVNGAGEIEVFAIGTDSRLYHLRYTTSGAWTEIVDLGVAASSLAAGVNQEGYVEVFGANTTSNTIVHASQDSAVDPAANPEGGSLDWTVETVEVESSGSIQDVITYTAEITVMTSYGTPSPGSAVNVYASELTMAVVNGASSWIDDARYATATANAAGQVVVLMPTESLTAPLLKVWSDQMPASTVVVVEPNADVQTELRNLTGAQLAAAQDAEGNPILPAAYQGQADTLASVVTQCLTLVAPQEDSVSAPLAGVVRAARQAKASAQVTGRIDRSKVPDQHWRVRVGGGNVSFERLMPDAAAAALANFPGSAGGFLGVDWGDLWEAVREGVGEIAESVSNALEVTISAVGGAINAAVTVVVGAVTYVWNGVITLVEQAFDVIEGVFETIGAAFERLFEWLGFLFDWNDILNTKNALVWLFNEGFGMMTGLLGWMQTQVDSQIAEWQQNIQNYMHQMANSVAGRTDPLDAQVRNSAETNAVQTAQSHNVMYSSFLNNASQSPEFTGSQLAARLGQTPAGDASQFLTNLQNAITAIEQNPSFANAATAFKNAIAQMTTNPVQAMRETLAGVIEIIAGLASSVLQIVQLVVDTILQALTAVIQSFQAAITTEWTIPFVSPLYRYITSTEQNPQGDPLSALDLVCLVMAIPTNVIYKAIMDETPFADLNAFQQQMTSQNMLAQLGITQQTPKAAAFDNTWAPYPKGYIIASACVYALGSAGYAYTSAEIDGDASTLVPILPPVTPRQFAFSWFNVISEAVVCFTSCPIWSITQPTAMGITSWIWSFLGLSVDTTFLVTNLRVPELMGDIPVFTTAITDIGALLFVIVTRAVDSLPWWWGVGNGIPTIPGFLKFTRMEFVYAYYPTAYKGLVLADIVCLPIGAITNLAATIVGLVEQGEATGALVGA